MARRRPQRPRDPNQLGKLIVDLSVGEAAEVTPLTDTSATEFARQGGLKGGKARAAALSDKRKSEIARAAAEARWSKKDRR
ncbi:MAG: histone H1 [Xanthobacteraceae bacterium]